MTAKIGVFDVRLQERILDVCSENEFVPIFLMMKFGCHAHDICYRDKMRFDGEWLSWPRCKNEKERRFLVPKLVREPLAAWLRHGRRISPDGLYKMTRRVGDRAGVPNLSPMSLRHTCALESLRRHRGNTNLVAREMGCTVAVAERNYLDLDQWKAIEEELEPVTIAKPAKPVTIGPKVPEKKSPGLVSSEVWALVRKKIPAT